ncbi:MAG: uracil phosphoribosyltransferase [Candidatus Heimdallarchaeaceae archaeon]
MLTNGSKTNILISEAVGKIRNKDTTPADFRINLKRIGSYLAYEASKFLETEELSTETPLGIAYFNKIKNNIVIITILRAAVPMSEGVLEVLHRAKVGIISAARGKQLQDDGKDFRIDSMYSNIPILEGKNVIIVDPMIASGSTLTFTLKEIKNKKPLKIIVLCAIASQFGIERIQEEFPEVIILVGAIDKELNEKGYIVPGLGDAGDRAFNT